MIPWLKNHLIAESLNLFNYLLHAKKDRGNFSQTPLAIMSSDVQTDVKSQSIRNLGIMQSIPYH